MNLIQILLTLKVKNGLEKELQLEVVDDFYSTPIKINKSSQAPIVKFKNTNATGGKVNCQIFNENLNIIDYNLVGKKYRGNLVF